LTADDSLIEGAAKKAKENKTMSQATSVVAPAAEAKANTFLAKVYLLLVVGLAVTALVPYWISEFTQFESLLVTNPTLGWGVFIVRVILVYVISIRVMKIVYRIT
jgi:FtsH-binding integral membrane protein